LEFLKIWNFGVFSRPGGEELKPCCYQPVILGIRQLVEIQELSKDGDSGSCTI